LIFTLVMGDAIAHEGRLCRPDKLRGHALAWEEAGGSAPLTLNDQRLSHELLVALERLAEEHSLVEAVVSSCGDSRAVVRPCGALKLVVRVREAPTLVAVVTVVRRRSFAEPLGDMGDARLLAALLGFRLEPDNRVGVLGEVIGPDGIHYFLLATLEAGAERLRRGFLQTTALRTSGEPSQSSSAGGVGLVVDSFRPKCVIQRSRTPDPADPGQSFRLIPDGWGGGAGCSVVKWRF
jgi:hypothetical protein